jgi:hypothetical protein
MRLIQATLILLLGAGYLGIVGWYPDVVWLESFLWAGVWPGVVSGFGLLIVLGACLLHRRDPSLVGWVGFSLAGCLLVIPLLVAKQQQAAHDVSEREQLLALREEVVTESRRREQLALEAERERRASEPRDRFSQYEGRVDLISLQAIRALDERMQAEVKEQADAYKQALDDNPVLGPSAWITFGSQSQLKEEQTAHQRLYESTRAFTQFIESFEDRYTQAIEELSLKPPADRIAIAEMERVLQSWEASRTYDLRKLDVEMLAAALNALNVLDTAWGQWAYNPREQRLSFENEGMERRVQEAMQRFQAAFAAVQAIRESELPSEK